MLESIAITVAPALAVVELKGRAEGRRADASTYETSATGSHDVSGGDVLPHCRAWRGSGGENGPRHMSTREESLGCGGRRRAPRPPPRGAAAARHQPESAILTPRGPPLGETRGSMTIDDTATLTDDDLLAEVRAECARWDARDDLESGFARLFRLRDEALRRGLPLPMSCPMEDPPGLPNDARVDMGTVGDTT